MSQNNKPTLHIWLLGDEFVGKTSLACRYNNEQYSGKYRKTIGAEIFRKDLNLNDNLVSLVIWDTSGYDGFKKKHTPFLRSADCCIFVFDVTYRKSFESLNFWRDEFFLRAEKNPNEFPVALVGTKIDLENEREVSKQEAEDWCKSFSIPYFECSAKDDINVQEVFEAMTAKLAMKCIPKGIRICNNK
ncbi:ras-related protein Rab-7a-like [Drosophila nasuta]|uniref:ras-related protein Rab-7a-like n=1 Tax=Drosophila nasuta TaxID=42062 RepID=UPI00295E528B|nr:ras-related protein Rab-7a-like [Drosophila nasuta]